MPAYDYRCLKCKRRFEVYLSYSEYGKHGVRCPHCNSEQVQRRIGRGRFARSEESRLDSLADGSYAPEARHYQSLFVIGIVLFVITFVINLTADLIVKGIRRKK